MRFAAERQLVMSSTVRPQSRMTRDQIDAWTDSSRTNQSGCVDRRGLDSQAEVR